MKLAILSDFHLGYSPSFMHGEDDAFAQAREAMGLACEKADALLVPGDIFDSRTPTLDVMEQGLTVVADRDRLMQVMVNLLSNALKFVPTDSGRVKVGAGATANEVRVSVTDNGPGIQAEDQEVIFDKFRQGSATTDVLTDKPQGTGLGLPISRQIIEYFNGRLWVESTPGAGARFVFTLPRQAGDNEPVPQGDARLQSAGLGEGAHNKLSRGVA